MRKIVVDIETNGLYNADTIWVAVLQDIETDRAIITLNKEDFNRNIKPDDIIIGHNFVQFDVYWLNKLWLTGIEHKNIVDTLVLSTLFNPDRQGGHSLSSWGDRLHLPKGEHNDWSKLTPEMVDYCVQDVKVTAKLYKHLITKEKLDFSEESIRLEHDIARIIAEQKRYGFYLNERKAHTLMADIKEQSNVILKEIRKTILPKPKLIREVHPKKKKDGTTSSVGIKHIHNYEDVVGGSFSSIEFEPFNLGSPKQIIERLNMYGWRPIDFTKKGQPRITEENLETIPDEAPRAIKGVAKWKMLETRAKTIEGWLDALTKDGRVHGDVYPMGAVTGRMTHANPNLANIVSNEKPYGAECRSCWTVPDDYVMVGMDAKGLELRMLAHYMKDEKFIDEVVNGDPHTFNQKAAGLDTRAQAKTFIYAFLYSAGGAKLGAIVGGSAKDGEQLKQKFLNNVPQLSKLINAVKGKATRGYIRGIDGRRLYVRNVRAALNTLLQGAGAIVCKQWSILLDKEIKRLKLDAHLVNTIHDEQQYEVARKDAQDVVELADKTIQDVGKLFNLRVMLNADAKIGNNWSETH